MSIVINAEVTAIMTDNEGRIVLNLLPYDENTFDLPNLNTDSRHDKQLYIPIHRTPDLLDMLPGDIVDIIVMPANKTPIGKLAKPDRKTTTKKAKKK
jgi:hypothetical protein